LVDKYGPKITYRIKHEDLAEYKEIKKFIIENLHTDICFVQWSLLRAFFKGMQNKQDPNDIVELKLFNQKIQLNIGCTINYNRMKARRIKPEFTNVKKNLFLPLVFDEWDTLQEKQKEAIRNQLIQEGIIDPPVSVGTSENKKPFFKTLLKYCTAIVGKLLGGLGLELRKKSKS